MRPAQKVRKLRIQVVVHAGRRFLGCEVVCAGSKAGRWKGMKVSGEMRMQLSACLGFSGMGSLVCLVSLLS